MMPLKIPHLRRCFVFFVMATYAPVRLIPRKSRALHLRHFERHQLSEVFAVRSYLKIILTVLLLLASPVWASEPKVAGSKPVDPAACKVLEKAATRLQLTDVEVFDARKSKLLKGFWNLSFSSVESGRMILFTDGEVAIPVVQKLKGNAAGNAVFREWQGIFVGDVHPDTSWVYLLKNGTVPDHYVLIVDNLWTETAADFMDWFEGKRSTSPYGEIEINRGASVYFVPSFGVFSRTDADLSKHYYALLDGGFLPAKYVVTALSRIDQAHKRDTDLLMRQVLVLVGPKRKEEYLRTFKMQDLKGIRTRTQKSYRKVGLNLPKFLIADGRFFMRNEDR
jgi:hypothetical protein